MKTFFFTLILIISISSVSLSQEIKISRKQVPAAVIKAFKGTYPKARIKGTNIETKEGIAFYEIESKDGKISRDVLYTKDGKVSEIEEMISADQLPQPVMNALTKNYSSAKVKSIEKNTQGAVTTYEVVLQNGKKKTEVVFSADGNIVNTK